MGTQHYYANPTTQKAKSIFEEDEEMPDMEDEDNQVIYAGNVPDDGHYDY